MYGRCRSTTVYQKGKWKRFHMGNPNLLPYETIVRATSGEPEAVDEVLRHYSKRIRIAAIENGHINRNTEGSIKQRLIAVLLRFRFEDADTILSWWQDEKAFYQWTAGIPGNYPVTQNEFCFAESLMPFTVFDETGIVGFLH